MRRVRNAARLCFVALLLAALLPAAAGAAVVPMGVEELAKNADAILTVKVVGAGPRKGNSAKGGIERFPIVTDNRLQVTKVIKGQRPSEVVLTQPGGSLGDLGLAVSDLPSFTRGERCILFLNAQGGVVGGYQGKLAVVGTDVPDLAMKLSDAEKYLRAISGQPLTENWAEIRRIDPTYSVDVQESAGAIEATVLSGVAASTEGITVSSITPSGRNAGARERVTITGAGFKSTRGTGRVEFPHGASTSGTARLAATNIIEWSDTKIVCEVPRRAQSGRVYVTNSGGISSAGFSYSVGFSASGLKAGSLPFKYRINENSPDLTGEGAAIKRALQTWSNSGSDFALSYAGTSASSANPPARNSSNDIYFASSGFSDSGMLGWNVYWFNSTNGILESDIVLNDKYTWSNAPARGQHDVESVILHELGHTVGLDDQYAEFHKVMGASVSGTTRRSLSTTEIDGALYIYGSAASGTAPSIIVSGVTDGGFYPAAVKPVFDAACDTGIENVTARLNGDPFTSGATVDDHGSHTLLVTATNSVGEFAAMRVVFTIDKVAPSATHKNSYASRRTDVTITGTDSDSGVSRIRYQVNGGAEQVHKGSAKTVALTKLGRNTVRYWAVDKAGNPSKAKDAVVYVKLGTALSLSAPATPRYRSATVSGYLKDVDGRALAGRPVLVQRLTSGTWKTVATVQTDSMGRYTHKLKPTTKASFRVRFSGDSTNLLSKNSSTRVILPKVSLTSPAVSATQTLGRTYRASGYLKPRHAVGSKQIKIRAYRYESGKWVYKRTYSTTAANYTKDGATYSKYTGSIKLPAKGKWRVRAYHAADSKNATTFSAYRYVTVK